MNNSIKISIIVPVYNVESYLERCIQSIRIQTFQDFEVILVDDGSKDRSGEICDYMAEKFPWCHVVHKSNGGLSSARNIGLDHACGEYVFFVDSDDEIFEDTLETLFRCMSEGIDMVTGGYIRYHEDGTSIDNPVDHIEKCFSIDDFALLVSRPIYFESNALACIHLFRRSIIEANHLRFDEDILFCEDTPFVINYVSKCKGNIYFTTKPIYKYYIRETSLVGAAYSSYKESTFNLLDSKLSVYRTLKDSGFSKKSIHAAAVKAYDTYRDMLDYASRYGQQQKKSSLYRVLNNYFSHIEILKFNVRYRLRKLYYKLH